MATPISVCHSKYSLIQVMFVSPCKQLVGGSYAMFCIVFFYLYSSWIISDTFVWFLFSIKVLLCPMLPCVSGLFLSQFNFCFISNSKKWKPGIYKIARNTFLLFDFILFDMCHWSIFIWCHLCMVTSLLSNFKHDCIHFS